MANPPKNPQQEPQNLPPIKNGEICSIQKIATLSSTTKPPPRYTEGTLLADMKGAGKFLEDNPELRKILREVSGLGTAATRAAILEGLKDAGYLSLAPKSQTQLLSTPKARNLISWLQETFPDAIDVSITAQWEAQLSLIALKNSPTLCDHFRTAISNHISSFVSKAALNPPKTGSPRNRTTTDYTTHNPQPQENTMSAPSEKQLAFAKMIADKLKIELPENVLADRTACSQFIDANQATALKPSDKQLAYAQRIASEKNITIPDALLVNGRELSRWIDEHK